MSETKVPPGGAVAAPPPRSPLKETVVVAEPKQAAGATTLRRNALTMPEVLAQSVANAAPSAAMALLPLLVLSMIGDRKPMPTLWRFESAGALGMEAKNPQKNIVP